jgi:hypothetical protein
MRVTGSTTMRRPLSSSLKPWVSYAPIWCVLISVPGR